MSMSKFDDIKAGLGSDPALITHYNLLKDLGIWDKFDRLLGQVSSLEELLNEAIDIFSRSDIKDVIDYVIIKVLDKFVPSYFAFIYKENVYSDTVEVICFENMRKIEDFLTIDSLDVFANYFRTHNGTVLFEEFEKELDTKNKLEPLEKLNPCILSPIKGFEGFYGFIVIGRKVIGQEYTAAEIKYMDALMKFVSISFQNSIHYLSAITDYKTGLYNYSYFKNRFEEELQRIKRYQKEAVLLMLDIDHFKNFNDQYGHIAGDMALVEIAEVLKHSLRKSDLLGRFGGEEFSILLLETGAEKGIEVAERIRENIEKLIIDYESKELKVTVSIGIRHISIESLASLKKVMSQADEALYLSKRDGRNRATYFKE